MAEKLHIGIDKTILDTMDFTKKYYLTTDKNAEIQVEEEVIPLENIQTYISSSQTELTNVENRLGTIEQALPNKIDNNKITNNINGVSGTIPDSPTVKSYINSEDNLIKTRVTSLENTTANLNTRVLSLENPDMIKAYLNTNLSLSASTQVIPFNNIEFNNNITNANGEFTVTNPGKYVGNLSMYINQSATPLICLYVSKKPLGGTWEPLNGTLEFINSTDDGSFCYKINGILNLNAGDTIRINGLIDGNGSAILENKTKVIGSVTLTQYPATISFYKI